jgi:hypothetical protein
MSSQIFAGDISGSVTIQCPNVAGTNVLTLPLSNGLIPGEMIYRLNTAVLGLDSAAVQSVLGVGITLNGNTVYQFEAVYAFSKAAGATSHNFSLLFGGTSTLNNTAYQVATAYNQTSFATQSTATPGYHIQAATSYAVGLGITSATVIFSMILKGTVSVNAGGTFIPQYQLSAAPGGAYTTAAGSYFKLSPIGTAGTINIGGWA